MHFRTLFRTSESAVAVSFNKCDAQSSLLNVLFTDMKCPVTGVPCLFGVFLWSDLRRGVTLPKIGRSSQEHPILEYNYYSSF